MKKILLPVLILIFIAGSTPSPAKQYIIEEADQSTAGYYKQKIEYEKWRDNEIQKAISDEESSKAYEQGIIAYERQLQNQAARAQLSNSLQNAALGMAAQRQQQQAINQQQQAELRNYMNQLRSTNSNTYSSGKYYNTAPKSKNGYPILDPYSAGYWK